MNGSVIREEPEEVLQGLQDRKDLFENRNIVSLTQAENGGDCYEDTGGV